MDLIGKIKSIGLRMLHRDIDVITCMENKNKLWNVFSSPATIKNGAKLVVDKTQIAALVSEGQLADIYECGQHELVASNMPILSTLKGWKYDHNAPFDAEVYFINTATFRNQNWETLYPFSLKDAKLKSVAIETNGTYSFCVKHNPSIFIQNLIKNRGREGQERWFNNFIIAKLKKRLETPDIDLLAIVKDSEDFSKDFANSLKNDFLDYDIILEKFCIDKFTVYKGYV